MGLFLQGVAEGIENTEKEKISQSHLEKQVLYVKMRVCPMYESWYHKNIFLILVQAYVMAL